MRRKKLHPPIEELGRPQIDFDDGFPPLQAMTHVYLNKPNLRLRGVISHTHFDKRKWKVVGMITGICNIKGWQEVLLPDGSLDYYHPSEMAPWRDDGEYYEDPIVDPINMEPCLVG